MIKKSDQKRLFKIKPQFFVDTLSEGRISWEAYGQDRRRLGKALIEAGKKSGFDINKSDNNCYMVVNYLLDDLHVIQRTKDAFEPSPDWKDIVRGLFPKENLDGTLNPVSVTETVETQEEETTTSPVEKPVKTLLDLYLVSLEKMGPDFVERDKVKEIIEGVYTSRLSEAPPKTWWLTRLAFLERNKLVEGIEDQGKLKYLRSSDYVDLLTKKPNYKLKEDLKKGEKKQETPQVEVVAEKPKEVIIQATPKKKPAQKITVAVSKAESHLLYIERVVIDDNSGLYVVELETSQANLDVLKRLTGVCVSEEDRPHLKEVFEKEKRELLDHLSRINALTGESA